MKRLAVGLPPGENRSYPVLFFDALGGIGRDLLRRFHPSSLHVVTDANVARFHGASLLRGLRSQKIPTFLYVVPAGERSKSRAMKGRLEDRILRNGVARDSLVVALGGGMIGDLAGFIAATMLRGVPYMQVPTTLLAQVDSSVGGKVAVDHPLGKNLIGAFYQPRAVYIAVETLQTLPKREFRSGIAEVIKYGAILDGALFQLLERHRPAIVSQETRILRQIVRRCCELKAAVVKRDERESGPRRILNFGHTIGHAIEQLSNYRLRHGESISIGMALEARLSVQQELLPAEAGDRLETLLHAYGLPTRLPRGMTASALLALMARDKKVRGNKIYFTLLTRIGKARIGHPVDNDGIRRALRG